MGGFMEVQLGKLCSKLVNGGTPSTGVANYWGGSIPWVTGADFTSRGIGEIRRYVSESGVRSNSTSVVDPGNLLVVTRTGVGKLAIAKEPIAISQDITGVYPDPTKTDTLFLYFLLV
jgi:type I restriction enzyme S subunit